MARLGLRKQTNIVIKRAVGWGDRALLSPFVKRAQLDRALVIYRRHHRKSLLKKVFFMPYAKNLLRYLHKKKYKLAIATNRPNRFTHILLKNLGIEKYFDYILCKDQIRFGKPHPSIINKILRKIKVNKNQVLYVGDMTIDIRTGKKAKVKTFAVATGSSTIGELGKEHPDYLEKNLAKLFKIL